MARVICTLPNASSEINGVKFVSHKLGMLSDDIDDDVAKSLLAVPGYHLYDSATKGFAGSGTIAAPPDAGSAGPGMLGSTKALPLTPDSLAADAAAFTEKDRNLLIDLLNAQKAKAIAAGSGTKPEPKVPVAGTPAAAGAALAVGAATSKTAGGAPNPTF